MVKGEPLSADELRKTDSYMRASLYLCLGMLYLRDNPLLKEPLKLEHLKARLLGHWGSDAGQVFTYVHFNRLICKYGLDAIFISGPGERSGLLHSQYSPNHPHPQLLDISTCRDLQDMEPQPCCRSRTWRASTPRSTPT